MDKLVAFFKNVWFKRSVAVVCWAYTALICWVAWLSFAYYFEFENATSLFVLYTFANIAALGLMIYTRKQVITMINCMVLPPIVFAIIIFGFGNWYMVLPPLVVVVAMFFINGANETLKTVLGTMYLLLYVIGVVAYIVINLLMGKVTFTGVDLVERDTAYERLSPSGEYRIVRYVDKPGAERRTAGYYVEFTGDDVEIPFGFCKKVYGCQHVFTSTYTSKTDDPVLWKEMKVDGEMCEMLSVEGSIRENPYLIEDISITEEAKTEESAAAETLDARSTEETGDAVQTATAVGTAE